MATSRQIQASRTNGAASHGPVTPEGKAAVRFNALTHGLDAQAAVIPGEHAEDLAALTESYYALKAPVGPIESFLVDAMIECDWARRRLQRAEAALISSFYGDLDFPTAYPLGAVLKQDAAARNALDKVARRQQTALRNWHKAEEKLYHLQETRLQDGVPELAPAPAPQPESDPLPDPPAEPVAAAPSAKPAPSPIPPFPSTFSTVVGIRATPSDGSTRVRSALSESDL
jgi:hypothetical protein